jgi:hypothetical protein
MTGRTFQEIGIGELRYPGANNGTRLRKLQNLISWWRAALRDSKRTAVLYSKNDVLKPFFKIESRVKNV